MKYKVLVSSKKRLSGKQFLFGAGFAALLGLVSALKQNSARAEFLTANLSIPLNTAAGRLTGILPFSVFEFALIAAVISVVILSVRLLRLLFWAKFALAGDLLSRVIAVALGAVLVYNLSVGFAYYRPSPTFGLEQNTIEEPLAIEAAEYFLSDFYSLARSLPRNTNGTVVSPYTFGQLTSKIRAEFANDPTFGGFIPRAKPLLALSSFYAYMGVTGIYFGPTAEPNVNMIFRDTYYFPVTIAHETAHGMGIMLEYDANMTAYYILLKSKDDYLRYCGYMSVEWYILQSIYGTDQHSELIKLRPETVSTERNVYYQLYDKYSGALERIHDKINNWYLEISGQKEGTSGYVDPGSIIVIPSDPDTSEPPKYEVVYSSTQKMLINLYAALTK